MRYCYFIIIWVIPAVVSGQMLVPGESYFSQDQYIEYIAGNLPLILTAPHGGYLEPASIPDRNCSGCSYLRDTYTQELTNETARAIYERTGCYPHVVINRLHRKKLDANRDIAEAADSNAIAEQAWYAFHAFLDTARQQVMNGFGKGFYVDVHGHGHDIQRMELGYLLSKTELQASDSLLNTSFYTNQSSVRNLVSQAGAPYNHAEILRGTWALGTLLHERGYPSVPSLSDTYPESTAPYFDGGYNTGRYSSRNGGTIDGVQIECNGTGVRDNLTNVHRFADSLAVVLLAYMAHHYFPDIATNGCAVPSAAGFIPDLLFTIAPNPAKDYIRIQYGNEPLAEIRVEILDWTGKCLFETQTIADGTVNIPTNAPQILLLRLTDRSGHCFMKRVFVVKN